MLKIDYVPRHLRLGVCTDPLDFQGFHDIVENIPVIDDDGKLIETHRVVKSISASEAMSKYKVSDFKLSALLKNGIPLKMVNVNRSQAFTIDELESIASKLDSADSFVSRVLKEREEKRSWFDFGKPSENSDSE